MTLRLRLPLPATSLAALRLACAAAALLALPAHAEGSASSASSAGSASSGSVSTSLKGSSNSVGDAVTDADYRITDVAAADGREGFVRVAMQSDARQELVLELPAAVFTPQRLAVGDTIRAERRVYGVEFARGDTRQAFFLVLADDWHEELAPRLVGST